LAREPDLDGASAPDSLNLASLGAPCFVQHTRSPRERRSRRGPCALVRTDSKGCSYLWEVAAGLTRGEQSANGVGELSGTDPIMYEDQVCRCGIGATNKQERRTRLAERIDEHDGGGDTSRLTGTRLLRNDCLSERSDRNNAEKQGLELHLNLRVRS
jgi:hypothetical protein